MQSKLKHLNDIITAMTRVFTISLMILLVWISHVWSEQKLSLNNYNISIIGSSILSSQYYKKYLANSIDREIFRSEPNIVLDKMYEHPFIKAARISYRYPDKIIIEISERIPFARVNNGPDQMRMLDEHCFVIPNIDQIKNYSVPILSRFNSEPGLYPLGKKALSEKIKKTINWLSVLNKNHPDLYHNISEIFLTNNDEINLVLAENPTIIMLGNDNTHYKMELLKAFEKTIINKKEITDFAYLDMRYNNQVIVKE
tara:strand:+ start:4706 stop:5473 length:768 start_codon:yes stop_codon:yes gene_type:complete